VVSWTQQRLHFWPGPGATWTATPSDFLADVSVRQVAAVHHGGFRDDEDGPQVCFIGLQRVVQFFSQADSDCRIEGVADDFLGPGRFQGLGHFAAHDPDGPPLVGQVVVDQGVFRLGQIRQVNAPPVRPATGGR
jgi:tRNA U34 2-thiouridine synthase MnmA/TrmU